MNTTVTLVHPREYTDYAAFAAKLDKLRQTGRLPFDAVLAAYPHSLAVRYAQENGLPLRVLAPNYARDRGLARAVHRDELLAATTHLVAFHDGRSRNVSRLIELARSRQLATVLVVPVTLGATPPGNEAAQRPASGRPQR